jgi:SAM-dependent methyltransferase
MKNKYDDLLEYYDELFPVEKNRIDFIESLRKDTSQSDSRSFRILDVGCATGTTALYLAQRGMVVGIDHNETMVQSATRRNHEPKSNARFFCMDMLKSRAYFPVESFDMVLCLGNTLAYLRDQGEIQSFFRQVRELLIPEGMFVFELLNYDRIVKEKTGELPPVETIRVNFTQKYDPSPEGHIHLTTVINSANGYQVFSDKSILYPLGVEELYSLLTGIFLGGVNFYRDFDRNPLDRDAIHLIGTAQKDT